MKPPWLRPAQLREFNGPVPSVAVVRAGGFLSCALPVIRLKLPDSQPGEAPAFVLVQYEPRSLLWGRLGPDLREQLLWQGRSAQRWFASGGQADRSWINAEAMWVRAAWLRTVLARVPEDRQCHGFSMLDEACKAALALAGEETKP